MRPAADLDDRSGAVVGGKYRLVRLLGRGGMGAVYEAENTWTRRRVATKLLRPEYARDRLALRRFMQEAQAASQIAHPNIIDVLDLGLEPADGSLYMVQELLHGEDLRARLRAKGRLDPAEALDVLVPVLGALAAAHERGVVHRDIKPENIFLATDSSGHAMPKLIDFGISKVLEPEQAGAQTGTGTTLGTPRYMAPEQVRGEPDVDARADVWSVGVVLYELFTGDNPFSAATAFGSANRVLTETPPPLGEAVSAALGAIVSRTMSRAPADRYLDARELLEALLVLDEAAGLRQRHAAAILKRPAQEKHSAAPLVFELMSQIGPATDPTLPANNATPIAAPSQVRRVRGSVILAAVAAIVLLLSALWLSASHTVDSQEAPSTTAAPGPRSTEPPTSAPPSAAAPTLDEKKAPSKRPTGHPRPRPPETQEGTNRAPILE